MLHIHPSWSVVMAISPTTNAEVVDVVYQMLKLCGAGGRREVHVNAPTT
jgi:hypothetical protein